MVPTNEIMKPGPANRDAVEIALQILRPDITEIIWLDSLDEFLPIYGNLREWLRASSSCYSRGPRRRLNRIKTLLSQHETNPNSESIEYESVERNIALAEEEIKMAVVEYRNFIHIFNNTEKWIREAVYMSKWEKLCEFFTTSGVADSPRWGISRRAIPMRMLLRSIIPNWTLAATSKFDRIGLRNISLIFDIFDNQIEDIAELKYVQHILCEIYDVYDINDGILLVLEKPSVIKHVDGVIHSNNEPAIVWGKDKIASAYFRNGIKIPKKFVGRKDISPLEILKIRNVEIRAVLMSDISLEQLVSELNCKVLDSDDIYILYDVPLGIERGGNSSKLLRMINQSTGEIHYEWVDEHSISIDRALEYRNGVRGRPRILT